MVEGYRVQGSRDGSRDSGCARANLKVSTSTRPSGTSWRMISMLPCCCRNPEKLSSDRVFTAKTV
eukprot:5492372-Prymnesium_polylepis.1